MTHLTRLAAFGAAATLLFAVVVAVDPQGLKRPLPTTTSVAPQGQLQNVRDTFERVPLIMGKIDGVETPHPTDHGSLVLSARAAVTFCLPDQLLLSRDQEVTFSLKGSTAGLPYVPVKPAGNFPPANLKEFDIIRSSSLRTRLSVRFDRESCSYSLNMTGLGQSTGNSTKLVHVMAMDDIIFTVTVFDDAKRKAYIGRVPVRVVESNDRD